MSLTVAAAATAALSLFPMPQDPPSGEVYRSEAGYTAVIPTGWERLGQELTGVVADEAKAMVEEAGKEFGSGYDMMAVTAERDGFSPSINVVVSPPAQLDFSERGLEALESELEQHYSAIMKVEGFTLEPGTLGDRSVVRTRHESVIDGQRIETHQTMIPAGRGLLTVTLADVVPMLPENREAYEAFLTSIDTSGMPGRWSGLITAAIGGAIGGLVLWGLQRVAKTRRS